jgi:hypothetical protein
MDAGKVSLAVTTFSAAEQYHPVLFALVTMGLVPDAHFLLIHLQANGLLIPCTAEQMNTVKGLMELEDLARIIEEQFQALLAGDL